MLSPFERVGSGALKPVRDFSGWVGDTFHAKKDNREMREELDDIRAENIKLKAQASNNDVAAKLVELDQGAGLDPAKQVSAHVIARSPTLWYSTVNIDKGTAANVRRNDAVVNHAGLVGRVTEVWSSGAKVTLITDRESGVTARDVDARGRPSGTVETGAPGNPNDLLMTGLQLNDAIVEGDESRRPASNRRGSRVRTTRAGSRSASSRRPIRTSSRPRNRSTSGPTRTCAISRPSR